MSTFFVQCNMPDIWRAAAKGVASRQAMLARYLQPADVVGRQPFLSSPAIGLWTEINDLI
jgi:hypothetical protein